MFWVGGLVCASTLRRSLGTVPFERLLAEHAGENLEAIDKLVESFDLAMFARKSLGGSKPR